MFVCLEYYVCEYCVFIILYILYIYIMYVFVGNVYGKAASV